VRVQSGDAIAVLTHENDQLGGQLLSGHHISHSFWTLYRRQEQPPGTCGLAAAKEAARRVTTAMTFMMVFNQVALVCLDWTVESQFV
jgi:hypothetical protein